MQVDVYRGAGQLTTAPSAAAAPKAGVQRTSNLAAPTMLLSGGHDSDVHALRFHPAGEVLATSSFDKTICLWNVYGECENTMVLRGHQNAVLEVQWAHDGSSLVSCSADKTVRMWDTMTGERIRKFAGHGAVVSGCATSRREAALCASGSDDRSARVWDARVAGRAMHVAKLEHPYQVTCCSFSNDGRSLFTAGVDNDIRMWDLRKGEVSMTLKGHSDTVTGMSLSPDGSYILTNAMDNQLRVWDVRPYAPQNRCIKIMMGHSHTFERNLLRCSWAPDSRRVAAGSGDRFVYVWNTTTRAIEYKLPGHAGAVNDVQFHPREPIIGSASVDRTVYLGELSY
eukprot:m51a1_g3411 putative transducin wd40 repeat-like superfamily protein isoform 1 (340) ;mRNA; f:572130-573282